MAKSKQYKYELFLESLKVSGYSSYKEYLASDEWKSSKDWYAKLGLPSTCLVCGCDRIELHHWRYEPIDRFEPWHLIPLCSDHHEEIHSHYAIGDRRINSILKRAFGLPASAMDQFFKCRDSLKELRGSSCKRNRRRVTIQNARPKHRKVKRAKSIWEKHSDRMGAPSPRKTFAEIKAANQK